MTIKVGRKVFLIKYKWGRAVHTLGKQFPFLSCDIIYYHKYGFVLFAFSLKNSCVRSITFIKASNLKKQNPKSVQYIDINI